MNTNLLPPEKGLETVFHKNGDTKDIIDVVLKGARKVDYRLCDFAAQFDSSKDSLRKLWSFVKYNIPYKTDPDGRQDILLPAPLWERGWGDCKSKSVFISHILSCIGVPHKIRFTSYEADKIATHVYPVAVVNGKEIIIDSVYDFFNREKAYSWKKDYDMSRIALIEGIGDSNGTKAFNRLPARMRTPDVKKHLDELAEKRANITPGEEIPLNKSVGEAKAFLLRRQLQLLRGFNPDKEKEYNSAISLLDKAIVEGIRDFKVSGIGVLDQIQQQVAFIIDKKLKNPAPALSWKRTIGGKLASIGSIPMPEGMNTNDLRAGSTSQSFGFYKFGFGTPYQKQLSDIAPAVANWIANHCDKPFVYNGQLVQVALIDTGIRMKVRVKFAATGTTQGTNSLKGSFVANPMQYFPTPGQAGSLYYNGGANGYDLIFGDRDLKLSFEKYVEEQSGVWQTYLQQTVFREQDGVGAGILYDFAGQVPGITTLNAYSGAVISKKTQQSQWLDNASYLTGGDRSLLQDMARNTYIYNAGQNPEDSLLSLYNSSRISGIGIIDPVTITAICSVIIAIIGAISAAMSKSKQDADILAPQRAVGFSPVGPSLMPSESDWLNSTGGGSGSGGSGSGVLSGGNNTLLGIGLLAAAAYFGFKKK